jgi:hypothetical protein
VTAVQYTDPTTMPAATNGHTLYITLSTASNMTITGPKSNTNVHGLDKIAQPTKDELFKY